MYYYPQGFGRNVWGGGGGPKGVSGSGGSPTGEKKSEFKMLKMAYFNWNDRNLEYIFIFFANMGGYPLSMVLRGVPDPPPPPGGNPGPVWFTPLDTLQPLDVNHLNENKHTLL